MDIIVRPSLTASKIVSYRPVKSAAGAKLRGEDADTAAIAQFVNFIEQIGDIESDFEAAGDIRNFEISLK